MENPFPWENCDPHECQAYYGDDYAQYCAKCDGSLTPEWLQLLTEIQYLYTCATLHLLGPHDFHEWWSEAGVVIFHEEVQAYQAELTKQARENAERKRNR